MATDYLECNALDARKTNFVFNTYTVPLGLEFSFVTAWKNGRSFAIGRIVRAQYGRGEFRVIGRIGIVLRFQAESIPFAVGNSVLTFERAIQKIAGVELDRGSVVQTSITRPVPGSYISAACLSLAPCSSITKLWSYPWARRICSSPELMRSQPSWTSGSPAASRQRSKSHRWASDERLPR